MGQTAREKLFQSVENYIAKNYVPKKSSAEDILGGIFSGTTKDMLSMERSLSEKTSLRLDLGDMAKILNALMSKADKSFAEWLLFLIKKSGRSPTDIYTKAGITKQHFSKIKNNTDYRPTKETALAFAVVLHLSVDETKDLIGRAGFTLSRSSKRDIIVEYFIKEKIYDMDELNYNLDVRGLGTLTNRRNGI